MGDAWIIGPFMIKEQWIMYFVAGLMAYLVLRLGTAKKYMASSVPETLWTALFIFAAVWKLSYTLFHPLTVWAHWSSQIYFTGGDKGVALGLVAGLLYLLYRSRKEQVPPRTYIEPGFLAILAALGIFQIAALVTGSASLVYGSGHILLCAILVVYWFVQKGHKLQQSLWPGMIFWFGLIELFLTYFKERVPLWLGFSFFQWVMIILCLITGVMIYKMSHSFNET